MKTINNSTELVEFLNTKRTQGECMQGKNFQDFPNLGRAELLRLGSVLAYDTTLAALRANDKQIVWHVAMPKSGSTWVTSVLKKGLANKQWKTMSLVPAYGRREQQVSPIELLRQNNLNSNVFAVHQHCMPSKYIFDFIKKFDVKLILQVRSITDCIVSFIDHLNQGEVEGPIGFLTKEQWSGFCDDTKLKFVLDFAVPWYISFWVSWSHELAKNSVPFHFLKYEDLNESPLEEFYKVAKFCDNGFNLDEVKNLLMFAKKTNTRKNKAVVGRGEKLNEWVHNHIQSLIKYYPETDFSSVGIVRS